MNKKKRSRMLKWIVMIEAALLLMIINIFLVSYLDQVCRRDVETTKIEDTRKITKTSLEQKEEKTDEKALVAAAKKAAASMGKDTSILVNKKHKIPKNYKIDLVTYKKTNKQVATVINEPLESMLKAGEDEGLSFRICSAYRSNEYQQRLVLRDVKKYMKQGMTKKEAVEKTAQSVQPSGYSEHATGLAVDIVSSSNSKLNASQEKTKEYKWLKKNCYKYGFILRYPKNKSDITGIIYEPWHFRYVGKKAARFITKNGLTYEEFCELLEKKDK